MVWAPLAAPDYPAGGKSREAELQFRRGVAVLAGLGLLWVGPLAAGAQEPPAETTEPTTTSVPEEPAPTTTVPPTTTTTAPPPTTSPPRSDPAPSSPAPAPASTTTTAPPPPGPTGPPPALGSGELPKDAPSANSDGIAGEAPNEEPPPAVEVPPAPDGTLPPLPVNSRAIVRIAKGLLKQAQAELAAVEPIEADARARVQSLEYRLFAYQLGLDRLTAEEQAATERLQDAKVRMERRAVSAYTGGRLSELNALLEADDVGDFMRKASLLEFVLEDGRQAVDDYAKARAQLSSRVEKLIAGMRDTQTALATARQLHAEAAARLEVAEVAVKALKSGSAVFVPGFVFPVAGQHKFWNDFGAPRMFGTPYAHWHEGNDIFATYGTPLVACERGVVTRMGSDVLGGTKLWLVGASGTRYYYAHLSAYAVGMSDGLVVEAGTVLGYVGDTGNARGTSAHLHFELYPPSSSLAANPYPLLRATSGGNGGKK